ALLTCDMVAAVHDWVKLDVQPLAKKHLGHPVVRMETMSSYSCRNAFGRKNGKLSEHGKANALDIRGFVTVKGETAYLLEDWGLTGVEIAAIAAKAEQERKVREIAEAKAKAEAAARAQALAAAGKGAGGTAGQASTSQAATHSPSAAHDAPNPLAAAQTIVEGLPKPGITLGTGLGTALGDSPPKPSDFGIVGPSRLGGPKPPSDAPTLEATAKVKAPAGPSPAEKLPAAKSPHAAKPADVKPAYAAAPAPPPPAPGTSAEAQKLAQAKSAFLRDVHTTACKRFMTTLGPEADKYHRNHFHIDLAERRTGKQICE
ncbi:MAG: extensin family protein, partial [Hyphomicrobiaceae bacterium]|nr:extensin family protein [Hyphomicrobiaceae bacterium]